VNGAGALRAAVRRPLSLAGGIGALALTAYALGLMLRGSRYAGALHYVDASTLLMLGLLGLRGAFALRHRSDLQAASTTLVVALSFVFAYEALYKWSFYLAPFGPPMPPSELREFAIQGATALTVLTGFADGRLRLGRAAGGFLILFAAGWLFWMLAGYGQIFQKSGETIFAPVLPVKLPSEAVYFINRITKILLCLAYFSFFNPARPEHGQTR